MALKLDHYFVGLKVSPELLKETEHCMRINGYNNKSDYIRQAIGEKNEYIIKNGTRR